MYNRNHMDTNEEKNNGVVNSFGCKGDICVLFELAIISMLIYII